ncbi:MAG: hypothetical protein LCH56_15700 [Proteobacteria bacterium]|nr:hypothetical protein [Pseudomonadota bacterium]
MGAALPAECDRGFGGRRLVNVVFRCGGSLCGSIWMALARGSIDRRKAVIPVAVIRTAWNVPLSWPSRTLPPLP